MNANDGLIAFIFINHTGLVDYLFYTTTEFAAQPESIQRLQHLDEIPLDQIPETMADREERAEAEDVLFVNSPRLPLDKKLPAKVEATFEKWKQTKQTHLQAREEFEEAELNIAREVYTVFQETGDYHFEWDTGSGLSFECHVIRVIGKTV